MNKNKILLISATELEISAIAQRISDFPVDLLISGVGPVQSTFAISKFLAKNSDYKIAIQAGICGTYERNEKIGSIKWIVNDQLGDTGIEQSNGFKNLSESKLLANEENEILKSTANFQFFKTLEKSNGITVSLACGNETTKEIRKQKFGLCTESMEGYPFYLCCKEYEIPAVQIRAISNYCGPRDKGKWNIDLAIDNLNKKLIEILNNLTDEI